MIHLVSTSCQVQQLKDKVAEIQVLAGAFWRFLSFEMDFLLSRSFQLVTVTIGRYRIKHDCGCIRFFSGFNIEYSSMFFSFFFLRWIGAEFFIRCGSRTATARDQCFESRSSTGRLWHGLLDFPESRLYAALCSRTDTQESHHLEWSV